MSEKKEELMEKNTIYKKIGSLRNKIDAVKKSNNNPFFKSKYADINTIERIVEPIEYEVGLTHFITSTVAEDGSQLLTLTVADVESGETLTSTLKVILAKNDMQQLISGHTYGRRGLLVSFYSLESEDDDGNSVSNNYDNPTYENKPKPQLQQKPPIKNYSIQEVTKLSGVKKIPIEKICDGYKIESLDVASQDLLNKIYSALLKK